MQVSEPQIEVLSGKKVPLCSFNAVGSVESTSSRAHSSAPLRPWLLKLSAGDAEGCKEAFGQD